MAVHATPYRPLAEKNKDLYCLTGALLEKVDKNEITFIKVCEKLSPTQVFEHGEI